MQAAFKWFVIIIFGFLIHCDHLGLTSLYASRGLTVGGSAVYVGLQQARQTLLQLVAHVLECDPDDIVLQEGKAHNRHYPHQPLEFAQLATFAHEAGAPINGHESALDVYATYTLPDNPYAFGARAG